MASEEEAEVKKKAINYRFVPIFIAVFIIGLLVKLGTGSNHLGIGVGIFSFLLFSGMALIQEVLARILFEIRKLNGSKPEEDVDE